jgi:vacuolar-type H+-ATPase subunit E/Vma4
MEKAEAEAGKIREEYDKKASDLAEKLTAESHRKAEEEAHRLIVNEQLELRKKLLEEKREILDSFFEQARIKIEDMPGEKYIGFIRKVIVERAITGKEEISVASGQVKLYPDDFVDSLNKELGKGGAFRMSGPSDEFSWGVVLREGKRVIDLSLETMFGQVKEEMEPRIAGLLFSGE